MEIGCTYSGVNTTVNSTEGLDFFCSQLPAVPLLTSIFSMVCVCVGAPASVWLLWVFAQRQRSGESNNKDIYMLSLTMMDLIYNLFRFFDVLNMMVWYSRKILKASAFLDGFNLTGRPIMMAAGCVDCFLAVVQPITYMRMKQTRYRPVTCALVWVFTVASSLVVMTQMYDVHPIVWTIPRFLAISTIACSDLLVLYTLRKPDPSGRSEVHPQKQRALQTITNSFAMTLVSYLPPLIAMTLAYIFNMCVQQLYCNVELPTSVFSMLGSTILPLLCLGHLGRLWKV